MRNESKTGRPTIGNARPGGSSSGVPSQKNSNSIWLAAAAVLSVLILALAILNFQKYGVFSGDDESSADAASPEVDQTEESSNSEETTDATAADQFPDSSELQALVNNTNSPWIVGHQQDFQYRISGVVPNEEIKSKFATAVTNAYGGNDGNVKNEIVVDQSLPEGPWLESSLGLVALIPFTLIDGAFAVNEEKVFLRGLAEDQADVDRIVTSAEEAGLPDVDSSVAISDLRPPLMIVNVEDGAIDLSGNLPSQRLIDAIVSDSNTLYGEENVSNNFEIDETTFARFPAFTLGQTAIGVFHPLGDFSLKIENGGTQANVKESITFEPGSAVLSDEVKQKLKRLPGYVSARASRGLTVIGHTDNTGDAEENQRLSQARAEAVKAYLVANGAPAESITAEGRGEQAGDSPEERAKNRRVEVVVGAI